MNFSRSHSLYTLLVILIVLLVGFSSTTSRDSRFTIFQGDPSNALPTAPDIGSFHKSANPIPEPLPNDEIWPSAPEPPQESPPTPTPEEAKNDEPSSLKPEPKWLIATMTAAHSIQRRAIIRATWQGMYRNDNLFSTRFVISNPGVQWEAVIAAENATYGDIILLPHLEENVHLANHIKTIEFFKLLVQQGRSWPFVSKIDDDSFLEPKAFWREYLKPLFEKSAARTIVARYLNWPNGDFQFPGGQFYTLTWDTIELVVSLYSANSLTDEFEDVLVGRLLHEADEPWELVTLNNPVAFDYDDRFGRQIDGVETAWAGSDSDESAWVHGVGPGAINPHKMKTDDAYLRVAACYGTEGLLDIEAVLRNVADV